jgi:hypothetical protein
MDLQFGKVYEGYNTILRNISPGIIILFPFVILLDKKFVEENYFILIVLYLIVSVISNIIYEAIGNHYFTKVSEESNADKSVPRRIYECLIVPSFHRYVVEIENELNSKSILNLSGEKKLRYNEYREMQDTEKYKSLFGDHNVFHRLNSIMICCDISILGYLLCASVIGIEKLLICINCCRDISIINNCIYLLSITILIMLFYTTRCIVKKSVIFIEIKRLKDFTIPSYLKLITEFRKGGNKLHFYNVQKPKK